MSAVLQPFGLKPVYHPTGIDRPVRFDATFWTGSANTKFYNSATTFYEYQPLTISAAGVVDAVASVASASTNTQIYGIFMGAEYNTGTGERRVTKYFVDGLASSTGDANVWFWILTQPDVTFEIQAEGSISNGAIGGQFNFSATAGRTPTSGILIGTGGGAGFSTCALNPTEVATGAQGQVRVTNLGRAISYPGTVPNAWGDAFTVVQVQLANTSLVAVKPNLS